MGLVHGADWPTAAGVPADGQTDRDGGSNSLVEQIGLQINLTIGDGDYVGRDVGGNVPGLRLDDRQGGQGNRRQIAALKRALRSSNLECR